MNKNMLGKPTPLSLRGVTYEVVPADLNDLCDLADVIGGLENLNTRKPRHMRALIWLALRRIDPRVTEPQKAACDYPMTEEEAGALLPGGALLAPETIHFVERYMRISELIPDEENEAEQESTPGNALAASV